MDKRHAYDFDTHIHLLVRGPGIVAGSTFDLPATQVDLAPTFLSIAGVAKPAHMDGHSLLPLLVNSSAALPPAHRAARDHLDELAPAGAAAHAAGWRTSLLIE